MNSPHPVFLPLPLGGNGLAFGQLGVIHELSSPCLSPSPARRERVGVRAVNTLRSFPRLPERPSRQHLNHPAAKLCRAVDVCWWLNCCSRNLSSFLDRALFSPVTFHRFLNLSDEQRRRMRSAHSQRRSGTRPILI